jgi:transposase
MWDGPQGKVYLAPGATDMRRSINGLSPMVAETLELDPVSPHWFVFCSRGGDKLKILHWQTNGFWLHYRRLGFRLAQLKRFAPSSEKLKNRVFDGLPVRLLL